MAGGRGSRMMPYTEKLTIWCGAPMALRVVRALDACPRITRVVAAVSPNAPAARSILSKHIDLLDTPGEGYSADLTYALKHLSGGVLVVPADLPLLDHLILDTISHQYDADYWTTILLSEAYASRLGISPGIVVRWRGLLYRYTGVSIVDADCNPPIKHMILDDYRLAININTIQDWVLFGAASHLSEEYGL